MYFGYVLISLLINCVRYFVYSIYPFIRMLLNSSFRYFEQIPKPLDFALRTSYVFAA